MKNNSLAKKMASYSSLATALTGMSHLSDAQIIYTDVYPEDTLYICGIFPLDLNNDGKFDFHFVMGAAIFDRFYGAMVEQGSVANAANSLAGVATYSTTTYSGGSYSYFKLPFKLNFLDPIGPSNPWVKPAALNSLYYCHHPGFEHQIQALLNCNYTGNWYGYWSQPNDGYLAMKINVDSVSYYGWARLSVDHYGQWMVLKDYAFNSIENAGLVAGEGMEVGIQNPEEISIIISPNPAFDHIKIKLAQNSEQSTLKMFNAEGREMMIPFSKDAQGWNADVKMLHDGIYIIEVKTATHTYRKKLLIAG